MPIPEELELQQAVYPASCSKGAAVTPDDGRKFTELYNVQHLQSAQLDRVSRVCISTIQRLYSMLCSCGLKHGFREVSLTRGDRQHVVRVQRSVWSTLASSDFG